MQSIRLDVKLKMHRSYAREFHLQMTVNSDEEFIQLYRSLSNKQKDEVFRLVQSQVEVAARDGISTRLHESPNLTHCVTGQLILDDRTNCQRVHPLHYIKVELWDGDFGHHHELGEGVTDASGFFKIGYNPRAQVGKDSISAQLRIYDQEHRYRKDGSLVLVDKLVYIVDGRDHINQRQCDLGQLAVPFWVYDPKKPVPRIQVVAHTSPPQSFSVARSVVLLKNLAGVEVQNQLHHAEHALNVNLPTIEHIQDSYPVNLTRQIEAQRPGYTRSDEYFGERILNGMSASVLDKDPKDSSRYWLHHHWASYEQDEVFAMPNVDIWLKIRDGKIMPVEISIQFRQHGPSSPGAPLEPPKRYTPDDGDQWMQAKRVARVSAALHTELDAHLVETHLNVEQYAIAIYRNLRRSPLRFLMAPHIKEVILINRDAEARLLHESGYFARATALTNKSIDARIKQTMGTLDWKNWRPRQILCEQHNYAKAAHLFWNCLSGYVDCFFEKHLDEIKENWFEVARFSDDLVRHSVPLFVCPFLQKQLNHQTGRLGEWFEQNERMDLNVSRDVHDGVKRAVSSVTQSEVCDNESLENMKQLCRYVIFHATFKHSWANSKQYDDGGELRYSGIGLRHGKQGVLSPEDDSSILPPPDVATDQLWFAWMLSMSGYGFITKNEEHDIHPELISRLMEKREAFKELGVDINTIQSRINI